MEKIKVGFFKKPQGVFTQEVIESIEEVLSGMFEIELFSGLDFRNAYIINGKAYLGDFCLNDLDVYFWHDTVRPAEWRGDNYYLNILKAIENDCVVINSSDATRIVSDKYLSHLALGNNGVPVGDFALVDASDKKALKKIFNSFGGDVLMKPRFGGWGIGIVRIKEESQLLDAVSYLLDFSRGEKEQILLEKYYPNDMEKWISVVVMGDKVLFGYRKNITNDSDWKIYDPEKVDGKGEMSEYVDPPEELKEIALKAKKAIGKDIIGFDFIYTEEGYKIIDENGRPGIYSQCLKEAGISIENEIAKLILSKTKEV